MRQQSNRDRKKLSSKQRKELLATVKARFEKYVSRHQGLSWADVQDKLEANPEKLWSLDTAPCFYQGRGISWLAKGLSLRPRRSNVIRGMSIR